MSTPEQIRDYSQPLELDEVREILEYIRNSPPQEHGGFHPQTVQAAREALRHFDRLEDAE